MICSDLLSNKIANFLYKNGLIQENHIIFYAYIYSWLIDQLFFFFSLLLISLLFHRVLPALIIYITISLLRMFSGGSHAPTKLLCSFISYFLFFSIFFLYRIVPSELFNYSKIPLLIIIPFIVFLSPVDNPNKRMNINQKNRLKIFSAITCNILFLLTSILDFIGEHDYCNIIILCVMITPVDLIIGFFLNKRASK